MATKPTPPRSKLSPKKVQKRIAALEESCGQRQERIDQLEKKLGDRQVPGSRLAQHLEALQTRQAQERKQVAKLKRVLATLPPKEAPAPAPERSCPSKPEPHPDQPGLVCLPLDEIQEQLSMRSRELARLDGRLYQLESSQKEHRQALDTRMEQFEAHMVEQARTQLGELPAELELLQEELCEQAGMRSQLEALRAELEQVQAELREQTDLRTRLGELQAAVALLREELSQHTELKSQLDELRTEVQQLQNTDHQGPLRAQLEEILAALERRAELKAQLDELRTQQVQEADDQTELVRELQAEVEQLREATDQSELKAQVGELRVELDQQAELKSQLEELREELGRLADGALQEAGPDSVDDREGLETVLSRLDRVEEELEQFSGREAAPAPSESGEPVEELWAAEFLGRVEAPLDQQDLFDGGILLESQ